MLLEVSIAYVLVHREPEPIVAQSCHSKFSHLER